MAADIGGTNSRFACVEIDGLSSVSMGEPYVFPTWLDSIGSLHDLLDHFQHNAPAEIADLGHYRAVSLGVAGAVDLGQATLPNIPWDIDLASADNIPDIFLLNDFVAQAHACLDEDLLDQLEPVRPGTGFGPGSIAIIGAGLQCQRLLRYLADLHGSEIRIAGVFDDRKDSRVPDIIEGHPRRGDTDDLMVFARQNRIDQIIIALPWSAEERLLAIMKEGKVVYPGRIGIIPRPASAKGGGVAIATVAPGTPAKKAELKKDDVIVSI
ncbi:MAG: glucokinase, partial [Planctomycetes bacterium]|nr:glucokinase [Planctomycetota bacterium]